MKKWLIIVLLVFGVLLLIPDVQKRLVFAIKTTAGFMKELKIPKNQRWVKLTQSDAKGQSFIFRSPLFRIDTIQMPMVGQKSTHFFRFSEKKELLWITGYQISIENTQGINLGQSYLCHNNVEYGADNYFRNWYLPDRVGKFSTRFIEMTMGFSELKFPDGFGFPLMTDENLSIATQALNLNEANLDTSVYHISKFDYLNDQALKTPLKPLFLQMISVNPLVDASHYDSSKVKKDAASCLPAYPSINYIFSDSTGQKRTGHWLIKPGVKETMSFEVSDMLALPFETTIHYIAIHTHPYAQKIELVNLSTDSVIFSSQVINFEDKMGLQKIGHYSSVEGIKISPFHRYAMRCTSHNTSPETVDMMAAMLLYMHDKELGERIDAFRKQ